MNLLDALMVGSFIGLTIMLIGLLPEIELDEEGNEIFEENKDPSLKKDKLEHFRRK